MRPIQIMLFIMLIFMSFLFSQETWWRQLKVGILPPGTGNAITDVAGVQVGQVTLTGEKDMKTGVTAILPHPGNVFQEKVPAAIFVANGFGKLAGYTQVRELGTLETPVILTNTLSVPVAAKALINYTLAQPGNEMVRSVNPVVGETNDGYLNNIRAGYVNKQHVLDAIRSAQSGAVKEGNVGAGTGTVCLGYKGGIGTASRKIPAKFGGYTVGALVQTNFGGILRINGAPVGEALNHYFLRDDLESNHDGSCMMIVATDAPLNSRQLYRLAKRAFQGMIRAGGLSTHGSGDYVIAFSTAKEVRSHHSREEMLKSEKILRDRYLSPLFLAAAEATEEAIYHSLFAAQEVTGYKDHRVEALPADTVRSILKKYNAFQLREEK